MSKMYTNDYNIKRAIKHIDAVDYGEKASKAVLRGKMSYMWENADFYGLTDIDLNIIETALTKHIKEKFPKKWWRII